MSGTTHDEARDLLAAYAMEILDAEERAAVQAHVATCASCTEELESLRATTGELGLAVPDRSFDARRCNGVRSRLLARSVADREARARLAAGQLPEREPRMLREAPSQGDTSAARWRSGVMLLAAVIAGLIVIGGGLLLQARDDLARARESDAQQQRFIAGLMGPGVRVIEVAATEKRAGRARMFWNQELDSWTFIAHGLAMLPEGRTYQLWLITPGERRISAGVFAPSRDGNAIATATHALAPDSLAAVAVTEEPAGGVAAPTGEIVLVGPAR
jgi:anti-sigma-K factor RskA